MSNFNANEEQQFCIDNIEGRFLVLAGPGTGKTTTVVHRIKNMLEKGINPEKILCLTFADAAASEMKAKLNKLMNCAEVPINIYTFHSFCNEIIGENAEIFQLPEDFKLITKPVSRQFLKECIDESNPIGYRNEKNNPYVFLGVIAGKIDEIKRARLTKAEYFQNIKTNPNWIPAKTRLEEQLFALKKDENSNPKTIQKTIDSIEEMNSKILKAEEIWDFYEKYKAKMEAENYIDFNDMIGLVLDKFEKSPAFLDSIANKYDYIMVDEYQDTNESQNEIVFSLVHASKSQNIFVVGDDDQIIYSFQGANLDTINNFLREFPQTKVVCLKKNMRSTQSILDVARIISKKDDRRLEINPEFQKYEINKDLIAANQEIIKLNKKVRIRKFQTKEQEFQNIADEIEKLINSLDCPEKLSDIAILCTGHADLNLFADLMKDRNIPFEQKDGKSVFQIKSSLTLISYLQALVNPELYSNKLCQLLLLEPFKFNPIDYSKIREKIINNKTIIESIKENDSWIEEEKIANFIQTYEELQKYISNETVRNIVMEVGAKTNIFNYFTNNETSKNENILALKKIISEADDFSKTRKGITITDFIDYLDMIQKDNELDILVDKPNVLLNAVQLSTYHSSKGKEYDIVYMPTLQSSNWNASRKSFKPTIPVAPNKDKTDEEWKEYKISDAVKTMYVGMTRAKHTLRLSYLVQNGRKVAAVCPWINDITPLADFEDFEDSTLEAYMTQAQNSLTKRNYDYKRDFKNLVKSILEKQSFSHSSVSVYKQCPRKYLYDNILNFQSRGEIIDAANYGSAVHETCEYLTKKAIKDKKYISKEEFINKFKKTIDKYPFSDIKERKVYTQRGLNELEKFYETLIRTDINSLHATEMLIKGEIDGIKVKGFIDKIIKNQDDTISIYDYKTTSALDSTQVCLGGKKEEYFIQLCLYKYFVENLTEYKVKDAILQFPIDSSELVVQHTKEDIEEVVNEFKNNVEKINSCEFEPKFDKDKCKYCAHKDFCNLDIV